MKSPHVLVQALLCAGSVALGTVAACSEAGTAPPETQETTPDAAGLDGSDAAPTPDAVAPDSHSPDAPEDVLEGATGPDGSDAVDEVQPSDGSPADSAPPDGGQEAEPDGSADSGDAAIEAEAAAPPVETLVRVMAANLTSGNCQCYDGGHGLRILQGLHPDVVLIQEFKYGANTPQDLRAFVDEALGPEFFYYRETGYKQIPNGIISRYPIVEAGVWDDPEATDREFVWARIDTPAATDLWAVSVHLLTSTATLRKTESEALIGYIESVVPAGAAIVLGGDFNTTSRTEHCFTVLSNRFVTTGPFPVDESGNGNTNRSRTYPYDWVVASPSLQALSAPLVISSKTFPNGLVFDSREYTMLDEVQPIVETDSAATNMQHMAVVRSFLLP